jgi:hypothetical protein
MATAYIDIPSAPPPPFLLRSKGREELHDGFQTALAAAIVAERQAARAPRQERNRIAHLLCELACQTGRSASADRILIGRSELAAILGTSLVKVKRALGLLILSRVMRANDQSIEVLDWLRLCKVAGVDPERLGLEAAEDDELSFTVIEAEEEPDHLLTAAGEPACFV